MKKLLFSIAFLCAILSNAQTIETKSSCDSNTDGKVDVTDVTNTANKVLGRAAAEKQMVTAEDLNVILQKIYDKLEALESSNIKMKKALGITDENGHDYVDLGLPSGLKWATMNVGATEIAGSKINPHTGQLDCYGEYYAWGETSMKENYTSDTYTVTSYNLTDRKNLLELEDDAAHVNWGGSWIMPTNDNITEMKNNCYIEWTDGYDGTEVSGYIVYKAKSSSDKGKNRKKGASTDTTASYSTSDTHIFIPASGFRIRGYSSINYGCRFWSSSTDLSRSYSAYHLNFTYENISWNCTTDRYVGMPIRPVCP